MMFLYCISLHSSILINNMHYPFYLPFYSLSYNYNAINDKKILCTLKAKHRNLKFHSIKFLPAWITRLFIFWPSHVIDFTFSLLVGHRCVQWSILPWARHAFWSCCSVMGQISDSFAREGVGSAGWVNTTRTAASTGWQTERWMPCLWHAFGCTDGKSAGGEIHAVPCS